MGVLAIHNRVTARYPPFLVVDTNVFAAALGPDPLGLIDRYAPHMTGARVLISFQTVAEVRYGALNAGWGTRRLVKMEERITAAVVIPPHDRLSTEWAKLRDECRRAGHALQEQRHGADLWVAATARLAELPLLTHDTIFEGTPGLEVIREG